MLLKQLKPFTKSWAQHGPGLNNFKVKLKLNQKINIRFGKEALELAHRVLMRPGVKKTNEYVLREALARQKRDFALAITKRLERNYIDLL